MLHMWIVFCLLLQVVRSFMIYNTRHGLCLQDSSESVQLKHCDLDSHFQQWVWDHGRLLNKGTARCLSSHQMNPVLTASCNASEGLGWHCHSHWLISHSSSLKLTTDGKGVFLSHENKLSKWRSLVEGNICLESSRFRRASDESYVLPTEDGDVYEYDYEQEETMNEEQRNYYQWYYRSEDPSPWKYAMLVLSSGALLLGCLLLGMGTMANRNRKKIGQYKAAAASQAARAEELQGMVQLKQACGTASQHSQPREKLALDSSEVGELRAGDVILKWKDGNVSTLYPDAPEEEV